MEDNTTLLDDQAPEGKVFSERMIWPAIFLGGPLVAGYLFTNNFKVFGRADLITKVWAITIVSSIIILTGVISIPADVNIPNMVIPAVYTGIASLLFNKYLKTETDLHISNGGLIHSWWRVAGAGLVSILIFAAPIIGYVFWDDYKFNRNITSNYYGLSSEHSITYDSTAITSNEIDAIGNGLINTGLFGPAEMINVYVQSSEDKYVISFQINTTAFFGPEGPEIIDYFQETTDDLNNDIKSKAIQFNLVDKHIDDIVKIFE